MKRSTSNENPTSIARRRQNRLADLVALARANSLYHKELYIGRPERIDDRAQLPITNKRDLMARYDDWATDPDITHEFVVGVNWTQMASWRLTGDYGNSTHCVAR